MNATQTLLGCSIAALVALAAEAAYLANWYGQITSREQGAKAISAEAAARKVECDELDAVKDVLGAVLTRYEDSTVPAAPAVQALPIPGSTAAGPRANESLPSVFTVLREANLTFAPDTATPAAKTRAWGAKANVEWHRLAPVLAAFESSYPLVITEEMVLTNPATAFSTTPTELVLKARFRVPVRQGVAPAPAPTPAKR